MNFYVKMHLLLQQLFIKCTSYSKYIKSLKHANRVPIAFEYLTILIHVNSVRLHIHLHHQSLKSPTTPLQKNRTVKLKST